MKNALLLISLFAFGYCTAQNTLNTLFYNIYRFPDAPPVNREFILRDIMASYIPDLVMVCELISEDGADRILNTSLHLPGKQFERAIFVPIQSDTVDRLQQMVFYNTHKLKLLHQTIYLTAVRDINHYTFALNTEDLKTDTIFLEVFVAHLKSSEGNANRNLRLQMVDTFVQALAQIPEDHFVLFGGDFNFYNAHQEPGYLRLVDTGNVIRMIDPLHLPGNWHDNDSFSLIHTQATRTSTAGFGIGGASGGMDDRFDFIMISQNLIENSDLSYVGASYRTWGNNGNCLNKRIDDEACPGPFDLQLRQQLHQMSDHAPVVLQLQTHKRWLGLNTVPSSGAINFPMGNVVTSFLEISWPAIGKDGRIFVYDLSGRQLYSYLVKAGKSYMRMDVNRLPQGMYFIKLAHPGGSRTTKFIKR